MSNDPITEHLGDALILVVDDYEESLALLTTILRHHIPGLRLKTASTGQEALDHATADSPDLVLLDVRLPDMSGFDVCRELKTRTETAATPILMVSGAMVASQHRLQGLESGADGYICKPFEKEELVAQVRALLRVKRYQDKLLTKQGRLEKALWERTRQLRLLYDHSPDSIFVEDDKGTVLDANLSACRLHGLARQQLIGRNMRDLVPPEFRTTAEKNHERLLSGETDRLDGFSRAPDGRNVPVEIRASRLEFEGHPAFLLHVRDVTERQEAEARRESVSRGLRAVVEVADELMRCRDVRTLHRRAVELAREKLGVERCAIFVDEGAVVRGTFGTDRDGRTTDEHDNVQPKAEFWRRAFQALKQGEAPCRVVQETRSEWRNGRIEILSPGWIASTPIVRSGESPGAVFSNDSFISGRPCDPQHQEIIAVFCSVLGEIVERKKAEEKLREAELKYRTLVEQMPAISYVVEFHREGGRTTYISPKVESLLGFSPEEWQRDPELWVRQLHPDDRGRIVEQVRRADQLAASYSLEYRVLGKQGHVLWFRNHGEYARDDEGGPCRLHGVMVDITARKQAEERESQLQARLARAKRMESLGLLAGGVAHDLNNILGPLVAYPELMMADLPANSTLRDDLQEINLSARRAAEVIQDLLSLARRGNYQLEPVQLNEVIQTHLKTPEFQALQAKHPSVRVESDLDAALPAIQGSVPHLTRMVANLVTNACEAMSAGGRLCIETLRESVTDLAAGAFETVDRGDYVVLRIRDSGEGIQAEDLEHIFEPFYTKRKMGRSGTGLGLAVVYGVVRDLSGRIDVDSTPGVGTKFSLYFPATKRPVESAPVRPGDCSGSETVLVVDDVKEQRDIAARILGKLGYQVVTADSGRAAVEYLAGHRADLVILDMIMEEGYDGLDTYRHILAMQPGQRCIIASGYAETSRVREAQRLGAGIYIRKPYTPEKISWAVRQELDRATA